MTAQDISAAAQQSCEAQQKEIQPALRRNFTRMAAKGAIAAGLGTAMHHMSQGFLQQAFFCAAFLSGFFALDNIKDAIKDQGRKQELREIQKSAADNNLTIGKLAAEEAKATKNMRKINFISLGTCLASLGTIFAAHAEPKARPVALGLLALSYLAVTAKEFFRGKKDAAQRVTQDVLRSGPAV
jgi:hypothetical protein